MEKVKLNTIEEAIEDFKAGNFVIVVDDEDRENEGDLIIAARSAAETPVVQPSNLSTVTVKGVPNTEVLSVT